MRTLARAVCLCGIGVALALHRGAAAEQGSEAHEPLRTFHVSPAGRDENDGRSPATAFRTLGRAAAVVEPGDLVLVSGGTYREHVKLERPGTALRPIVFRAAAGETALVTYGKTPRGFRKVNGRRFTYAAPLERPPNDVWEERTVTRYVDVKDPVTLEGMPGAYLYDEASKMLHVHPLRGSAPDEAGVIVAAHSDYSFGRITGTIRRGLESWFARATHLWDKGFEMKAPYNRVEGFSVAYFPIGIHIAADHCEARNNTVYGCREGIYAHSGDKGVIAQNRCFRNYSHGIVVQTTKDVVVADNFCWHNEPTGAFFQGHTTGKTGNPHNLALYGGWLPGEVSFIRNIVVAAYPRHVFRIKNSAGRIITTQNVFVGGNAKAHFPSRHHGGRGADYSHNTVIGGVFQDRHSGNTPFGPEHCEGGKSRAEAPLYLRDGVKRDSGFADPGRHDYRLHAGSVHLGKGAFSEAAPVRYVSPKGKDTADGRTPKTAWKTIGKAASSALPGVTVYILPGTYKESVSISRGGTRENPIAFKSHGRGRAVLDGGGTRDCGIALSRAAHVTLDGLIVQGFKRACVRIAGAEHVQLIENVFDGGGTGVSVQGGGRIVLANNTFYRCRRGLDARALQGKLVLRNNLFAGPAGDPVVFDQRSRAYLVSERNGFWPRVRQTLVRETHASLAVDVRPSPPDYLLPERSSLAFAGLDHKPIGAKGAPEDRSPVTVENFRVASGLPNTAIVAWDTPYDYADAELRWSAAGGETKSLRIRQDAVLKQTSHLARLTGLAAGRTYRITLTVRTPSGRKGESEMTFKAPLTVRPPVTLYVSPRGADRNTGRSRAQAFRSLSAATLAAAPGDTILVAPGVYYETLRVWTGGISKDRHLTFRSERPGEAVVDCSRLRSVGVLIENAKHVTIDGFRIVGDIKDAVRLANLEDVVFMNNVLPDSRGWCHRKLFAERCRGLVISNNLFATGWTSIRARNCDDVTLARNTVSHGAINPVWLDGQPGASYRIVNNIFYGYVGVKGGKDNPALTAKPVDNLVCDYNLYWQLPSKQGEPNIALFNDSGTRGNRGRRNARTVEEAVERYGIEHHGRFADPMFVNARKGDFHLRPGSPAVGMGENGVTVGWHPP